MVTGDFSVWWFWHLGILEFGDTDDVVIFTLVNYFLVHSHIGDFDAGEFSVVICVLVLLSGTHL